MLLALQQGRNHLLVPTERQKLHTKSYILYYFIYIKSKNRQKAYNGWVWEWG